MLAYVMRRLVGIAAVLLVMSILIFAITQVLPGNVANIIAGQFASDEVIAAVERDLGLNEPAYLQYFDWISGVLSGDFGQSIVMERPVGPILLDAILASSVLAILSLILVGIVGIILGVVSAIRENSVLDHSVSTFTYLGISVPEFFWGLVMIMVFARYLGWFPPSGAGEISEGFWNWASHLVLPTITLTFTLIAHVSRHTRSSMIEVLRSNYIRNARAKGLPERTVIFRHALRNALLPTITILAIDLGWLIGGIVVVEVVYSYPGLGRLVVFAIERQDLPLIQASILFIAAVYAFANLAADLIYAYLNPRIRYG